ncbi:transcription initiation factor IIB-like [Ornithodoros turicata]|uniref:transcription initiation factor IIB-like n=1 Tax=Ornithodoros turicata TaxID=34597 RepID=UPI0031386490
MASGSSGPKVYCPYHPDALLVEDYHAGDMICSLCGLVVGDRIVDVSSEWRTFRGDNDQRKNAKSRAGDAENALLSGSGLCTVVGQGTGNASFDESGKAKYKSDRWGSSSDQALIRVFKEISAMADRIHLPRTIVDRSNLIYKQVKDRLPSKSRCCSVVASACLYIACRQEGAPRTLKEICAVSSASKKQISHSFQFILKTMETRVDLITTDDFMSRFCCNLALPLSVQRTAACIARKAVELDIVPGRSPISVAAAAIYMASQASKDRKSHRGAPLSTLLSFRTRYLFRGCSGPSLWRGFFLVARNGEGRGGNLMFNLML